MKFFSPLHREKNIIGMPLAYMQDPCHPDKKIFSPQKIKIKLFFCVSGRYMLSVICNYVRTLQHYTALKHLNHLLNHEGVPLLINLAIVPLNGIH
jgi:hypothetical protein